MTNVFALQTARAGSKSVVDKNIMKIGDKPLYRHSLDNAIKSKLILKSYVSTDIEEIIKNEAGLDYEVILRPEILAGDNASHQDAMIHGIKEIERRTGIEADIVVVLLGNTLGAPSHILDNAVQFLIENEDFDSVLSVSEFNMFNPLRAYQKSEKGLVTFLSQEIIRSQVKIKNSNDKNSAGDVYFANGSFFICRGSVIKSKKGMLPFPWLGFKIKEWIQDPMMEIDAPWQIDVLESQSRQAGKI